MAKKFLSFFLTVTLILILTCKDFNVASLPATEEKNIIKWVDFDVTYQALEDAMNKDIETFNQDLHVNWIDILAYLAAKYGGGFSSYSPNDMEEFVTLLENGESVQNITENIKYFKYYHQAYSAVLGNFLGLDEKGSYGLNVYSPIADGYWYTDSDDFGNGRDYGFARKHLGHDMFCSVGTPVICVESGNVEALGWNQYGGWRIGIRSFDKRRYYYYAHLCKDSPYIRGLKEGSIVKAGQLIGYSGQSGYSIKENVNNINVPHLHFGMQLVFDESQKECNSEIWIDTYAIIRLLSNHRSSETTLAVAKSPYHEKIVSLPILMYHGLTEKQSQVNTYFIPVSTFESDLKYLKENNYTSITLNQLIEYVYDTSGEVKLPYKPVILTFDDGYCNNYTLGTPLLKRYGMKAVISVIGNACREASDATYRAEDYCNVTWNQLAEMNDSGLWEIQNHTYDLHEIRNGRKGASMKPGESPDEYKILLAEDISQLQSQLQKNIKVCPEAFTWPYGAISSSGLEVIKSLGFKASMTCYDGINQIEKGDTENLFYLKRNLRSPEKSIESLL